MAVRTAHNSAETHSSAEKRLGELLLQAAMISLEDLEAAQQESEQTGARLSYMWRKTICPRPTSPR
jgi:hypothetical protein